jgi:hypothetical protein
MSTALDNLFAAFEQTNKFRGRRYTMDEIIAQSIHAGRFYRFAYKQKLWYASVLTEQRSTYGVVVITLHVPLEDVKGMQEFPTMAKFAIRGVSMKGDKVVRFMPLKPDSLRVEVRFVQGVPAFDDDPYSDFPI